MNKLLEITRPVYCCHRGYYSDYCKKDESAYQIKCASWMSSFPSGCPLADAPISDNIERGHTGGLRDKPADELEPNGERTDCLVGGPGHTDGQAPNKAQRETASPCIRKIKGWCLQECIDGGYTKCFTYKPG